MKAVTTMQAWCPPRAPNLSEEKLLGWDNSGHIGTYWDILGQMWDDVGQIRDKTGQIRDNVGRNGTRTTPPISHYKTVIGVPKPVFPQFFRSDTSPLVALR